MRSFKLILAAALLAGVAVPSWAAGGTASKVVVSQSSAADDTSSYDDDDSTYDDDSSYDDDDSADDDESSADDGTSSEEPPPAPTAGMVTAEDPQTVLDELGALGYPGKLSALKSGRPTISLRIAGLDTYIDFYDCADDMTACYTLLFGVDATLKDGATPEKVNEWNSKQITGRVWTDDKGQPTLDYTVSTFSGVAAEVFDGNVKQWADDIDAFKSFFGLK